MIRTFCHSRGGGNPDSKRKENMLKKNNISRYCCPNILFACPESILGKSKARFRRLQNSPAAQTIVIACLALRQDLFAKNAFNGCSNGYYLGNRASNPSGYDI